LAGFFEPYVMYLLDDKEVAIGDFKNVNEIFKLFKFQRVY
jgi:hypothetical protein